MPHFLGMEMPIALTISGFCIILVSGHVFPPGSSPYELLDMGIVSVLVLVLLMVSLLHQKNLLDRIPIAIDWFVLPFLLARELAQDGPSGPLRTPWDKVELMKQLWT